MTEVVGFGAGGHAKVVIEILRSIGRYQVVGLLDKQEQLWGKQVLGVPVLGGDSLASELKARGINHAFVGIGTVDSKGPRRQLYDRVSGYGFQLVPAIHPDALISASASIGIGPTIMAGVIINAGARLGNNVIVNTGSIVEHDCVVGDDSHIATGARLAGDVHIGRGTHVGVGACVRQGIRIGDNVTVGAGAVVIRDVDNGETVFGVPAKSYRKG